MKIVNLFILILLLTALLSACGKEISKEEAILKAREFIDAEVKLFTSSENNDTQINQASVTVTDTVNNKGEWGIYFHIQSEQTGETKKTGLVVVVDAKTGEINRNKVEPFRI